MPETKLTLPGNLYADYATLAIGSGFALFLYPHTLTGALSSRSRYVVQRNAIFLPVYTVMLGLLAILGYLASRPGIQPDKHYGNNIAVPALLDKVFPPWFAGFGLASIAIGALVPAAMMAIAAAEPLRPQHLARAEAEREPARADEGVEARVARRQVRRGRFRRLRADDVRHQLPARRRASGSSRRCRRCSSGSLWRRLAAPAVLAGWAVGTAIGTYLLVR